MVLFFQTADEKKLMKEYRKEERKMQKKREENGDFEGGLAFNPQEMRANRSDI